MAAERTVLYNGEKNAEWARETLSNVSGVDNNGQAAAREVPPTIILVEDNPADVLLLREALTSDEVKPRLYVASDGEEGIRMVDAIDDARMPIPDLIVIDLNLPRKSGFEVLARVRSSWRCGETPVAIFSSSGAPTDRERATRMGASRYILKPSTLKEFLSIGERLKEMMQAR